MNVERRLTSVSNDGEKIPNPQIQIRKFIVVVMYSLLSIIIVLFSIASCRVESKSEQVKSTPVAQHISHQQTDHDTTLWKELTSAEGFNIDIKYATADNFIKKAIYPCGRCFLKPSVASALSRVLDKLKKDGFGLKLFDCYRPRSAQFKLWEKVPDPDYVAPPSEGSMHNRGVAIDLTLTDNTGKELNLGTPYDFFGSEAHHDFTGHPDSIQHLRNRLKSTMEAYGFQSIRTEWWHYSFATGSFPLEDWQWPCE